jgi:hypothetical protein
VNERAALRLVAPRRFDPNAEALELVIRVVPELVVPERGDEGAVARQPRQLDRGDRSPACGPDPRVVGVDDLAGNRDALDHGHLDPFDVSDNGDAHWLVSLAHARRVISLLPDDSPGLGVLAFAVAGLGCSALLPLTISFAQEQLVRISASVAGGVIAFYQLGYGIAAFGAGPLQDAGLTLPAIFGFTAAVAVATGVLGLSLARPPP